MSWEECNFKNVIVNLLIYIHILQLYEIDDNPKRREFLDELFTFMQKRGKEAFHFVEFQNFPPCAAIEDAYSERHTMPISGAKFIK